MANDQDERACENTDRELWRETQGDYYAPSLFVTKGGGIGINVGGSVYVMPVREWHQLACGEHEKVLSFARDERRRAYTEVLGEARRRAEATPQIEYIAALALLALADWCEYKQQAEEEAHG